MSRLSIKVGKNRFELDINERITFIGGDSATGKTLLVNAMYDVMKNPSASNIRGISAQNVRACKGEDTLQLALNNKKCLIVIDRYDIFSGKSRKILSKEIEKINYNTWIIMTRRPDFKFSYNPGVSAMSFGKLVVKKSNSDENIITLVKN